MARFTLEMLLLGCLALPTQAAFTSLYAFGDGVCTTTNGPGGPLYYGNRYSNGRIWLEVLAQRQGLAYEPDKNWSYFGHYSENMVTNVSAFSPPADAKTALFVVWVNDADFVENVERLGTDLARWTAAIDQTLTNHYQAITNLYYAKGVRTLVLPNAVDLSEIPYYCRKSPAAKSFIRQRIVEFNFSFSNLLNQARVLLPDLTIYSPDFFALLDDILARSADYGVTNSGIDALEDQALAPWALDGPGALYVFWDYLDPTAKVHAIMADAVQQMISPASIVRLTVADASNRLDVANIPVGRNGIVSGSARLSNWTAVQEIVSSNATQAIFVPTAGPRQFYRLVFPAAWSWP